MRTLLIVYTLKTSGEKQMVFTLLKERSLAYS